MRTLTVMHLGGDGKPNGITSTLTLDQWQRILSKYPNPRLQLAETQETQKAIIQDQESEKEIINKRSRKK